VFTCYRANGIDEGWRERGGGGERDRDRETAREKGGREDVMEDEQEGEREREREIASEYVCLKREREMKREEG